MRHTLKTILSISSLLFLAAATQPAPPPDAPANKPENKKVAEIGEPEVVTVIFMCPSVKNFGAVTGIKIAAGLL